MVLKAGLGLVALLCFGASQVLATAEGEASGRLSVSTTYTAGLVTLDIGGNVPGFVEYASGNASYFRNWSTAFPSEPNVGYTESLSHSSATLTGSAFQQVATGGHFLFHNVSGSSQSVSVTTSFNYSLSGSTDLHVDDLEIGASYYVQTPTTSNLLYSESHILNLSAGEWGTDTDTTSRTFGWTLDSGESIGFYVVESTLVSAVSAPVPEPSVIAVWIFGIAAMVGFLHRRP